MQPKLLREKRLTFHLALLFASAASRFATAAETSVAEIFLHEPPPIRAIFDRVTEFLAQGRGDQVAEILAEISNRSLPVDLAANGVEGAAPDSRRMAGSAVLNSGASLSIGAFGAVRKIVDRLLPADQKRWRDLVEPALGRAWSESRSPADATRRALRRRIIRDFADSVFFVAAAEEEIDLGLERGETRLALEACRTLVAAAPKDVPAASRWRAATIAAAISLLHNDVSGADRFRKAAREILESGDAKEFAFRARSLNSALGDGARPLAPPVEASEETLNPLGGSSAAGSTSSPAYELGSVVWQSTLADQELRRWVSGLTEARRSQREAALARDVPLPFYPVARGDIILWQEFQRIVAVRASAREEVWSHALEGRRGEVINSIGLPAIDAELVVATLQDRLLALNLSDGALLWERTAYYDRKLKTLAVAPPHLVPSPAPETGNDGTGEERARKPPPDEKRDEKREVDEKPDEEVEKKDADDPADPADPKDARKDAQAREEKRKKKEADAPPVVSLSPPSISGGAVIFLASVRVQDERQLYAVCLERSGSERWITSIGSFRAGDFLGQVASLAPPRIDPPRVYICTNLGVAAAVDLGDGATLWARRYPRLTSPARAESVRSRRRWAPNPPFVSGGRVLMAPQDSELLIAIDGEDGSVLWQAPRDQHSTILGADDERCYLGGHVVSAIRLQGPQTGTTAWRWQPQSPSTFTLGRGILAALPGNGTAKGTGKQSGTQLRVLVPEDSALIQLDAASGRLLSAALWDFHGGGGNILLAGDTLAAASAGELLLYDSRDRARRRIANLPEEERLLESAKLDLKFGDLAASFASLHAWADLKPSPPAANSSLYRLRFELAEIAAHWIARDRGAPASDDASRAELHRFRISLEPLPERKLVAAIDAARDRQAAGDLAGALGHLLDALRIEAPPAPYPVNDLLTLSSGEVIRDLILSIREAGPPGQKAFAAFETEANEALGEALRLGTQPAFRRVIEGFPFTRAALAARRELAEYLLNRQNPAEAIRILVELLQDYPDVPDSISLRFRIADLLVDSQRYEEAREVLVALSQERGDVVIADPTLLPDTGPKAPRSLTVRQIVDRRLSMHVLFGARQGKETGEEISALRFPIRKSWRSPANLFASGRTFLHPDGARPSHLQGTFFTRSRELIECRNVEDGFPRWTVELSLIPGFHATGAAGAAFFFQAPPPMAARFLGDTLLLKDPRNLLAIDTRSGRIAWHRSFGRIEDEVVSPPAPEGAKKDLTPGPVIPGARPKGRARIFHLGETLAGITAGAEGIFATTSMRKLICVGPDGADLWKKGLDFEPAADAPPKLHAGELTIFQEAPVAVHFLDARDGRPLARIEIRSGADARLIQRPVVLPGARVLLALRDGFQVVDLAHRKLLGGSRDERTNIQRAWWFAGLEAQAVLHINRTGRSQLAGVDLETGLELWRYDRFADRSADISVHADGPRLYVIHGEERWSLLGLEIGPDAAPGRLAPHPMWPNEVSVGMFFSRDAEREVLISQDAVFVPDPSSSSVAVHDKFKGSVRTTLAAPITQFLVDKRSRFAMEIVDGVLVLLTEGGDCGFEAAPRALDGAELRAETLLVRRYMEKPDDTENVARLARWLFIHGEGERAIALLDRALQAEALPTRETPNSQQHLAYLLGGFKEESESIKDRAERLSMPCRRLRAAPLIDGELNDAWNYTSRVELRDLRHVGWIQAPGQPPDVWTGEEDLSATLYTGWDDENFYFALDVEDANIYPYDKEADSWRGDCLIIGLDPTGDGGFFQRGDDQLLTLALTMPKRKPPGKEGKKDGEDGDEDEEGSKPRGLFSVKKKDDNSGVIYEVGLPWKSFGGEEGIAEEPVPGRVFGLSLLLTDDDSGQGAAKTLSPNTCHLLPRDPKRIWKHLIPEYFPRVILE